VSSTEDTSGQSSEHGDGAAPKASRNGSEIVVASRRDRPYLPWPQAAFGSLVLVPNSHFHDRSDGCTMEP
jgi:hypothetical protein